nr:dystrophia myotonica WD repeat-containing protein [Tanacetum cinerariifolium]
SNPIARWHICQGPINAISFSADGRHLATVGRDGYLRVFDFLNEQLICGGKSYYGALLCCAWSPDGKYILTGGEDDLVQVWSMEDRKVVAWGEGHNSWVSGVAFDSYWSPPSSEDESENAVYRFGSVGQDTQLLLWDLAMDELVVPLRRPPGGSPTYSRTQSSHWDSAIPVGTLQPAPSTKDVPQLAPLVAHRVHSEPLSGLIFSQESILTASRDGHVKIWTRPGSDIHGLGLDLDRPYSFVIVYYASQRSKEDDVQKISMFVFVTNFPDGYGAKDLWNTCKLYGDVVEVFIPDIRTKAGKRFGLVRFIKVFDIDRLMNNLCTVWVGRNKINANVARFQREPLHKQSNKVNNKGTNNVNHGAKGNQVQNVGMEECPNMVLDETCLNYEDFSLCLLGKVKEFASLTNLKVVLDKEEYANIQLKYMRGFWVMIVFQDDETKKRFQFYLAVGSWFSQIIQARNDFVLDERVIWVEVEGVPCKWWSRNTFSRIDLDGAPGWVPDFEEDGEEGYDVNDGSHEDDMHGGVSENLKDVKGESDRKEVFETNFEKVPDKSIFEGNSVRQNDVHFEDPFTPNEEGDVLVEKVENWSDENRVNDGQEDGESILTASRDGHVKIWTRPGSDIQVPIVSVLGLGFDLDRPYIFVIVYYASQRSKEDDVQKISMSVFVTNFPDGYGAKDLWNTCKLYGHVVNVFIHDIRTKAGKVKEFASLTNLKVVLDKEGYANIQLKYMRGFWVMIVFQDDETKKMFQFYLAVGSWFSQIIQARNEFVLDERVIWVEVEGVPCKWWSRNTFSRIAGVSENLKDVKGESDREEVSETNFEEVPDKSIFEGNSVRQNDVHFEDPFVVIMGDFIEVHGISERFGSIFNKHGAKAFNSFIVNAGLVEVPLGRCSFMWCRKSAKKMSKLDRFLISDDLMCSCPSMSSMSLDRFLSDHRPIIMREAHYDYGPIPFKFFHYWFELDGFDKLVERTWLEANVNDQNSYSKFMNKLKYLKEKIRICARLHKESLNSRKSILKAELADLDGVIDKGEGSDADGHWRREVVRLIQEVEKVNKKRGRLTIRGVLVDGIWMESPHLVKHEFFEHFKNRFEKPNKSRILLERDFVKRVSLEQNDDLERDVSNEEIKRAVWDCGIDKASGPDGFTFEIPKGGNSSFIILIPKVPNANMVKDFRPISLIGSLYKVIAKVLANRLVTVLDDIVDEIQSAFVMDRQFWTVLLF